MDISFLKCQEQLIVSDDGSNIKDDEFKMTIDKDYCKISIPILKIDLITKEWDDIYFYIKRYYLH